MSIDALRKIETLSVDDFVAALKTVSPTQKQWEMLELHASAPDSVVSASVFAQMLGFNAHGAASLHYGRLAGKVCKHFEISPGNNIHVFVEMYQPPGEHFHWRMRDNLKVALSLLGRVGTGMPTVEIGGDDLPLFEGGSFEGVIERARRNRAARLECISHHGYLCKGCGFNFEAFYGAAGAGYVEIHHLSALSEVHEVGEVNPITDLVPLCANCHRVVHRKYPAMSLSELRASIVQPAKSN